MSDYPMLISNKLHSFRNFKLQIYNIFKQSQQQHENKFIKMQLYTLIYENSYGNAATKIYRYSLVASR